MLFDRALPGLSSYCWLLRMVFRIPVIARPDILTGLYIKGLCAWSGFNNHAMPDADRLVEYQEHVRYPDTGTIVLGGDSVAVSVGSAPDISQTAIG